MAIDAAHKRGWQIGEVVFGVPCLMALVLQLAVPLALPTGFFTPVLILGGVALVVVGVALIVLARREFAQYGQPTDPGHPTSKIVTTGVFSISRNPIYLGAACFLSGLALTINWPWMLVLLLAALVACHYVLIAPEEKYLAAKFGEEYRTYATTVHRWIGQARRPG